MTNTEKRRKAAIELTQDWFIRYSDQLVRSGQGPWIPTTDQYERQVVAIDEFLAKGVGPNWGQNVEAS